MTTATTSTPATSPAPRRTLFAIADDLLALDQLLDDIGGDVSDQRVEATVTAWLAELAADEAKKLDGWVGYVKQLEMEASAARAEAEQFTYKAKARESRVAWLKFRLKTHLEATGRKDVKTLTGRTIAVQANGGKAPLEIDPVDPEKVEDRLCKVTRSLDTEAIRADLEAGEKYSFARLLPRGTQLRIR